MSGAPLIGLTTYGRGENNRYSLPAEYVDAVRRAGGIPVLIWLESLDGLILSGGGDIDPARYGGSQHETLYNIDHERDDFEFALVEQALSRRMPLLCICRGMQVLNIHLGGTLYEHVPDVYGEEVLHRAPPREPTPHALRIVAGTHLAGLLGREEVETASWHHQSVNTLGRGLVPAAYAPDGLVEAVELPDYPWLVAVQWHPELTAANDPLQQGLFDAFVGTAGG
ncbi:MAG: gamma-glutamyl-gamma-aminobutyrate hydrolase family protein [Acidihalobacter sp.]